LIDKENCTISLANRSLIFLMPETLNVHEAHFRISHFTFDLTFGVKAATESITTMSIAPERIKFSAISNACSPLSG
jgi:hypothetical protein